MTSSPIVEWMFSQEIMKNALLLFFPWLLATWNHYRWTHLHNVVYTIYLDATSTDFFFSRIPNNSKRVLYHALVLSRMGKNTTSWSKIRFCCQICEILANGNAKLLTWKILQIKTNQWAFMHFKFMEISSSLQDILYSSSELATVNKESRFKQRVN